MGGDLQLGEMGMMFLCEISPQNAATDERSPDVDVETRTLSLKVISAAVDQPLQISVQVGEDGEPDEPLEHNFGERSAASGKPSSRAVRLDIPGVKEFKSA